MNIQGGYAGRILRLNLENRTYGVEELREDVVRLYIGGSGLAAKILFEETEATVDPLGPQNVLIFMNGPLTGTRVPLSGRHEVVAKSPLTGIYGESDVGGTWGCELRHAGYDGVVVKGVAQKPTYIWISDGGIEFRNATHVWGMDTYEVDTVLKKETDEKAVVQTIGPAGERLARIAGIFSNGKDGRPAARCGLGAVMGSKRLKAICVRGNQPVQVAREDDLSRSIRELGGMMVKDGKSLHDYGTSGSLVTIEQLGDLPIKNWAQGRWEEGAKKLSGQRMAESILTGRYYCGACIVGCGRTVSISSGPYAGTEGAGPEYEALASLGAINLTDDLGAVAKANELCNRYGLDVISTGIVIGFAIEAYEKGLISSEDTGGLQLQWGNPSTLIECVHRIGRREGFGWLLGEGVKRVAESIGGLAPELALHVKGLELPAHDPRAYNSVALAYATSNRGACHLQGFSHAFERNVTMPDLGYPEVQDRFAVKGKGEFVAKLQNLMSLFDSAKLCKFTLFTGIKAHHVVEWLNIVVGWDMSLDEFMKAGERIFNLKRMYNVRCGISRKDDTLPPRALIMKRGAGGASENLPPLGEMLSEYYKYRGWDELGIPTKEKLASLDLDWLTTALPKYAQQATHA